MSGLFDSAHRARISEALDETLFVQAGAGSGKTTALVGRLVRYIATGRLEAHQLAAITFSEAAAAELRARIRAQLTAAATELDDHRESTRCARAVHTLDSAAITTLHGFALSILREFPIEAGLPPIVEPLDDVTSIVAFDLRWQRWLNTVDRDPQLVIALGRLAALGVKLPLIRELAVILNQNWDRVAPFDVDLMTIDTDELALVKRGLVDALAHCSDPADKLAVAIQSEMAQVSETLELPSATEDDQTVLLSAMQRIDAPRLGGKGVKKNWGIPKEDLLGHIEQAYEPFLAFKTAVIDNLLAVIASKLSGAVLDQADERRRSGQVEFHDLLVRSVRLLRDNAQVRAILHDRYKVVLLDEFQDTDPLQIDLAVLIAGDTAAWIDEQPPRWQDIAVGPGRMFFVGDAKQSIYRFRRADLGLFSEVGSQFESAPVELSQNFRSVPSIIEWVNATFGTLMTSGDAGGQPRYVPLVAARPAHPGVGVHAFGGGHPSGTSANDIRHREAAELAGVIREALADDWPVFDGGSWRAARLSDIAILLPARTSLVHLETALDAAMIPYRVETSTLIYGTQEVHDLVMTLHALDDPNNDVAIVAALSSTVCGCADDELLAWAELNGTWNYTVTAQPGSPSAVAEAMTWLADVAHDARSAPIAHTIERVIRERSLVPLAGLSPRPRDVWRRLRFVHDQARVFATQRGATLRQYLRWVDLQRSGDARVREVIVPEADIDAVRILTMHGSKGLEFPITCLSGLSTRPPNLSRHVQVMWGDDQAPIVRLKSGVTTRSYDDARTLEEQMGDDERLRLLYVAATRARDHLVFSTHYLEQKSTPKRLSFGQLLSQQMDVVTDVKVVKHCAASKIPTDQLDDHVAAVHAVELPTSDTARDLVPTPVWSDATPLAATVQRSDGVTDEVVTAATDVARHVSGVGAAGASAAGVGAAGASATLRSANEYRRRVEKGLAARLSQDDSVRVIAATSVADTLGLLPRSSGPVRVNDGVEVPIAADLTHLDGSAATGDRDDGEGVAARSGGAAVGRAVHSVLQLADPEGCPSSRLQELALAQAHAEGVGERADQVLRLASTARTAKVLKLAGHHRSWRELYVGTEVHGTLLEGYVDVLIEGSDGLVIVDYKTDPVSGLGAAERLAAQYRYQAATYALALERTSQRRVERAVFIFANAPEVIEVDAPDLVGAQREIIERLAALERSG